MFGEIGAKQFYLSDYYEHYRTIDWGRIAALPFRSWSTANADLVQFNSGTFVPTKTDRRTNRGIDSWRHEQILRTRGQTRILSPFTTGTFQSELQRLQFDRNGVQTVANSPMRLRYFKRQQFAKRRYQCPKLHRDFDRQRSFAATIRRLDSNSRLLKIRGIFISMTKIFLKFYINQYKK